MSVISSAMLRSVERKDLSFYPLQLRQSLRLRYKLCLVHRANACRVEHYERAACVLVASENSAPDESRRSIARHRNMEINALQLLLLQFHLVRSADELYILNPEHFALPV